MSKIFTLLSLLVITTFQLAAQSTVSGRVVDEKKQGSSFANILILNKKDSSFVKGGIADTDGYFTLSQVAGNTYLLSITAIGYKKYYKTIEVKSADLAIGDVQLEVENQTLGEVVVTAKKPLIERTGDKMILNVEASPITSGLTGLELLEKVPGITVDKNSETIKLKGKSGVLVMIDDRQTYLSEEQLAAFLKTLKSDDIEKIEVITNPSARYDAAGATGIINIKTKKGKNFGTNYILDLGLGYSSYKEQGNFPKNSQGITMSTKKEKFALYANVSRNYNTWFNTQNENQRLLGESQELDETRINKGLNKGANGNWNAKVGLDYDLSKNTVVGITALAAISDNNMTRTTDQLSQTSSLTQQINMIRNQIGENRNYTFNTHLKQTFDTSGTSLNVDFDMIFNRDYNNSLFKTTTIANENQTLVNNQIIAPSNTHTFVLKSDFIKNLSKKVKLETGFKTSFSSSDKDFDDNFRDNGALVNSFFRFKENINAGYVMLNSELTKKLNLQLGLRGEQTNTLGEDRLGNQISKQNYFNLFPTVSLNQKVTKDYTVSLGYSRRINRPWANNFNTFKRFYSPFQYFEGNPNILPSLNNSISLTHTFKDAFSFSFSFVNVDQFASDVYDVDTTYIPGKRLVRESFENIKGKVNWWSFDVSLPFNVTKWWNVNINIWSGINVYNYQRADAVVNVSQPYGGTYIQQTFTLTKTLTAELSGFVTSGETWGFETGKPQGNFNIGFKKFIWDKKGTIKLSIDDPANLNNFRNTLTTNNLVSTGTYRWDNQRFRVNFTYNFGNTNVKVNQRSVNSGDGDGGGKGGRN